MAPSHLPFYHTTSFKTYLVRISLLTFKFDIPSIYTWFQKCQPKYHYIEHPLEMLGEILG